MKHMIKIAVLFSFFLLRGHVYAQSGQCFQNGQTMPGLSSGSSGIAVDAPPNTAIAPNSDPDSQVYPDPFPTKRYVYKVIFHIVRDNQG
jgi:hypothetical protein